jgi:hypothetical protein
MGVLQEKMVASMAALLAVEQADTTLRAYDADQCPETDPSSTS